MHLRTRANMSTALYVLLRHTHLSKQGRAVIAEILVATLIQAALQARKIVHIEQMRALGSTPACSCCMNLCLCPGVCVHAIFQSSLHVRCGLNSERTYLAHVVNSRTLAGQSAVLVRGPGPLKDAAILAGHASGQTPLACVHLPRLLSEACGVVDGVPVALARGDAIAAHSREVVGAEAGLAWHV